MKKIEDGGRKRLLKTLSALALMLLLLCAGGQAGAETKLMAVSDLHYLAPELYRGSDIFVQGLRQGDGKITQYGEELLSALYRQILLEQPDALIITGDLTYNGEKKSHIALAQWLKTVEDAGVPVWVIPGNHDINVSSPVGFGKGLYYGVEAVTPEEFKAIYADFMDAGEAGCSYTACISDEMWVAMTDVSLYQDRAETYGVFTAQHAAWLEDVLRKAKDAGVRAVTATHHSLLPHTDFARENFLMFGHESMAALAERYGVRLNLSGHLHIQHIARRDALADAAQGAFCIWPHRYALVTLDGENRLRYEAKALDEAFLPEGFLEESREWFLGIAREKTKALLSGSGEQIDRMADYAARFNLAYFSGTYRSEDPAWTEDPAYALWTERQDSSFWPYMKLVMSEAAGENLRWQE